MAKTKTLNIRISEEDYQFLESFTDKTKVEIVRRAIKKYRTKVETLRQYSKGA